MSNIKSSLLGILAIGAILSSDDYMSYEMETKELSVIKNPPIPKGCKEYFFNSIGDFSTERMRKDECAYKCVASNDKTAIKKFEKWRNSQRQST